MWDIHFKIEDVEKRLKNLKQDKAPGPDGIHPKILKECAVELARPIYRIFRKSLDEGKLPSDWRTAVVSPIWKKGSRTLASNYRPISLTSVVCKVLEAIIRDEIVNHVNQEKLFTKNQHGFTTGKSCLTNLLETLEDWTSAVDQGHSVDAVFLDFQKAFDTVPFRRLMLKLRAYGVKGKLASWIESFLSDRKMQVSVRGSVSRWCSVKSGVPQGSVLGPLLFLSYINDLPENVSSSIELFADDTKIWNLIRSEVDRLSLQDDLGKLNEWSKQWLLRFNIDKCKKMHIGKQNSQFAYKMTSGSDEHMLQEISEEKDLGVWISKDLKPSKQCTVSASKAMNVLRAVKKSFESLDVKAFNILYKTFVRPHLEYCVQAWSPYYVKDIQVLEKVQRRATKLVEGLSRKSYEDRLAALRLYSLEQRRIRGDLIETYKIVTGKEGIDASKLFKPTKQPNLCRHCFKLYKDRSKLLLRQNFFSQRVVNLWNQLPREVVEVPTVNMFKNRLDIYWKEMGTK